MLGRTDDLEPALDQVGGVKDARRDLGAEDTGDGLVQPRGGDLARPRLGQGIVVKGLPGVRGHEHVEPGVDRIGAAVGPAAGQGGMGVPVADQQALEAQRSPQDVGQQRPVAGVLGSIPAREGHHDRQDAGVDGLAVAGQVDVDQFLFGHRCIAPVATVGGSAVGEEMLGRSHDIAGRQTDAVAQFALQSAHEGGGIGSGDTRLFGEPFIGPAPAVVAGHGQGRGEGPVDTGRCDFLGRGAGDGLDQGRVARGAEADVVRKDGRPDDVGVAVHSVDAEQQGHACAGAFGGGRAEGARQVEPGLGSRPLVAVGGGTAAGQYRADRPGGEVLRLDRADVRLDQLTDLLLDGHDGEQVADAGLGRRAGQGGGAMRRRPKLRMGRRILSPGRRGEQGEGGDARRENGPAYQLNIVPSSRRFTGR